MHSNNVGSSLRPKEPLGNP